MLPKTREDARSKGERNDKKSMELVTLKGEKLEAIKVIASDWYDQPREKRRRMTNGKENPLRRSKRFTPE